MIQDGRGWHVGAANSTASPVNVTGLIGPFKLVSPSTSSVLGPKALAVVLSFSFTMTEWWSRLLSSRLADLAPSILSSYTGSPLM